jgi:hypothetical protein
MSTVRLVRDEQRFGERSQTTTVSWSDFSVCCADSLLMLSHNIITRVLIYSQIITILEVGAVNDQNNHKEMFCH